MLYFRLKILKMALFAFALSFVFLICDNNPTEVVAQPSTDENDGTWSGDNESSMESCARGSCGGGGGGGGGGDPNDPCNDPNDIDYNDCDPTYGYCAGYPQCSAPAPAPAPTPTPAPAPAPAPAGTTTTNTTSSTNTTL